MANSQKSELQSKAPVISRAFGLAERTQLLEKIETLQFDTVVIGGGITGTAIARDAQLRGLKTLLVEKDDLASCTSSRSSKLIHGGVRYLEQGEFKLVFEATRERARLWRLAPHLAHPIPFVFPVFRSSRVPLWKLNIGLWLYDILSLFRSPSLHKKWNRSETLKEERYLKSEDLVGSIFYWDGATDDALLTLSNALDAFDQGASLLTRAEVCGIEWNKETSKDPQKFHLVQIKDSLSGKTHTVKTRTVISAAGPYSDQLLRTLKIDRKQKLLKPTRGSHIVVPFEKLPSKHAVVLFHPVDGRVLFTIPFGKYTVVGTTDVFDEHNPDLTAITQEEVSYLIKAAHSYFPECPFTADDIVSTWSGLRPLLAPAEGASTASQVSREHHLEWFEPGLCLIAGGKLTTHREMAEQCVERLFEETMNWELPLGPGFARCNTQERPLPQTLFQPHRPSRSPIGLSEAAQFDSETLEGILKTQMVLTLEDFLVRRTQIFYKEPRNGLDLLPKLKPEFQKVLKWTDGEWEAQVDSYKKYLNRHIGIPLGRPI